MSTAFERFWLTIRYRGQSVAEKYGHLAIEDQRAYAARAFELWRRGKLAIDYDAHELRKVR